MLICLFLHSTDVLRVRAVRSLQWEKKKLVSLSVVFIEEEKTKKIPLFN